ncbi:MAG: DUF2489 domain-containing protein [Gammaproteobacteria bacterium HGW-Gammaproteobacteria-11]|nr:MAG: DUF2489 domain-containing protein [Gammaproteobacteria bacterium HGW-Gammaproteobacteria-11]
MSILNWLAVVGLVIILALAVYAIVLWRQVLRRQALLKAQQQESTQQLAADIRFLAGSLLDGQLPLIEGCIRIKVLLDNYQGPGRDDPAFAVFERIYDDTAHIPTHQAWKDLPVAERRLHERRMETLERDHKESVEQAARLLAKGLVGQ